MFEKYIERIESEQDRILFNEAKTCWEANCKRAAFITMWLCIIESLKRKIEEASSLGEHEAEEALKQIRILEETHKSADGSIRDYSEKLGLISTSELETLRYLWQRRSFFAHPYNENPSAEEFFYIVEQGVSIVLSKPLRYKKSFIDKWIRHLTETPHYIPDDFSRVKSDVQQIASRIAPELHPYTFKSLLAEYGKIYSNPAKQRFSERLKQAINFILIQNKDHLSDPNWKIENRLTDFPDVCFACFINEELIPFFSPKSIELMIEYILSSLEQEKTAQSHSFNSNILQAVKFLNKNSLLPEPTKEIIFSAIDSIGFESILNAYSSEDDIHAKIVQILRSINYQNIIPVIRYLSTNTGFQYLQTLSPAYQSELGYYILNAASGKSWASQRYLQYLSQKYKEVPTGFVKGLTKRIILSNRDIDYDNEAGNFASPIINALDNSQLTQIVDEIKSEIKDEHLQSYFEQERFDRLVSQGRIEISPEKLEIIVSILK